MGPPAGLSGQAGLSPLELARDVVTFPSCLCREHSVGAAHGAVGCCGLAGPTAGCSPSHLSRKQLCSWFCCPWMWLSEGNAWKLHAGHGALREDRAQLAPGHSCNKAAVPPCWALSRQGDGREWAGILISWMASQTVLWAVFFSGNAGAVLTKISQSSPSREPFSNHAQLVGCFWGRSLNSCCLEAVIH